MLINVKFPQSPDQDMTAKVAAIPQKGSRVNWYGDYYVQEVRMELNPGFTKPVATIWVIIIAGEGEEL